MSETNKVFSEYEVKKIGIKFANDSKFETCECIGSAEDESEVRVITKKCRGVVRKKKVKATGTGKVKLSLHCPWKWYVKAFGMKDEKLEEGVYSYGEDSIHEEFAMTEEIEDEDGNRKFKAYPNCVIEAGKASKITNGADEVAEIELEVSYMPDEYGKGEYEALESEVQKTEIKNSWLENFDASKIRVGDA